VNCALYLPLRHLLTYLLVPFQAQMLVLQELVPQKQALRLVPRMLVLQELVPQMQALRLVVRLVRLALLVVVVL
jgi:hypothetical protein